MEEIIIHDLSEVPVLAKNLLSRLDTSKIIAFSGDLGSGKTTIINEICKCLEVEDHTSSPTFSIVNEYYSKHFQQAVFHIDLYRLKSTDEIWEAGIEEYIGGSEFCFIEWPEKIKENLPKGTLFTCIEMEEDSENRKITIFKV